MRILTPLLVLLAGCPAGVGAEAIDGGFGLGLSALYVKVDGGDYESESVVISTEFGACDKYATYSEAYEDFYKAALDVMAEDYCEDLEEPFTAYVEAAQALFPAGARSASFGTDEGDFDTEKYDMPDEAGGVVTLVEETPYEDALDDFDADGSVTDGCGLGEDGLDDGSATYWTLEGDLDITTAEKDGPVAGTVDADMIDEDGDEDGAFTASFTATLCEIDL